MARTITAKTKGAPKAKAESKPARAPKVETKVEHPAWDDAAGADLTATRERLGLTRQELALEVGCTASRVRELELNRTSKGPTHPGRELAERLDGYLATATPKAVEPEEPKAEEEEAAAEEPEGLAGEVEAQLVGDAGDAGLGDEPADAVEA